MAFLDNNGVSHLWGKIKSLVAANKYTHPTSAGYKHIPAGGSAGQVLKYGGSSGTAVWGEDEDTTYGEATTSAAGLMSAEDKEKLDGVAAGANKYTHPSFTARASGLYKITVNNQGHVSAASAVSKSDITVLGIPGQDTTYSPATASANGLMSASDKAKLDGFSAASEYAKKSDLSAVYRYKGAVANASALPSSGQQVGDTYDIQAASTYGPAGTNVAWNGTTWDSLGGQFVIEAITNAEIDDICVWDEVLADVEPA